MLTISSKKWMQEKNCFIPVRTTQTEGFGWSVVSLDRAKRVFSTYSICKFDGASPSKSDPLVISAAHTVHFIKQ